MEDLTHQLGVYLHLARASQQRRRPMVRDRLLVLAGATAVNMQLPQIAAYCRHQVLQHNPRHLVGRWTNLFQAMEEEEFQCHLRHLKRRYPCEKAERMLESLGIQMARERDAYFTDQEYAAAILGTTTSALAEMFGEPE